MNLRACLLLLLLSWTGGTGAKYPVASNKDLTFERRVGFDGTRLSALADVNSDRHLDVLVVNQQNGIDLLLAQEPKDGMFIFNWAPKVDPIRTPLLAIKEPIKALIAADFNGDSVVDVLVLTQENANAKFKVNFCPGARAATFSLGQPQLLMEMDVQPLVADFNADGTADVYGEANGKRYFFLGGQTWKNSTASPTSDAWKWSSLGYSAFGDVDGDKVPDSLILEEGKEGFRFALLKRSVSPKGTPDFTKATTFKLPAALQSRPDAVIGQFRLADFNRDGKIELILPACLTKDCKGQGNSKLFLYKFHKGEWSDMALNMEPLGAKGPKGQFSFSPLADKLGLASSRLTGFVPGDVNSDTYMDLAVALAYTDPSSGENFIVPAMLMNENGKSFRAALLSQAERFSSIQIEQITFIDYDEDGIMDLWITGTPDQGKTHNSYLEIQKPSTNNYFLMVMLLNGRCSVHSPHCLSYGLPLPGSSVSFTTHSQDGAFTMVGLTSPSTSCNALEMPFTLFGLTELANYVDQVSASVADANGRDVYERSMDFVVPNSQLVFNPLPRSDPDSWPVTLFLQPLLNLTVAIVACCLGALMLILAVVIGILQYIEVREDRAERLKESQGFHFDAM